MSFNPADELIRILEYRKSRGQRWIYLSEKTRSGLFAARPVSRSKRRSPAARVSGTAQRRKRGSVQRRSGSRARMVPERSRRRDPPVRIVTTGSDDARMMFIGEVFHEPDSGSGAHFSGEAGQLFARMVNAMQFSVREVSVVNIIRAGRSGRSFSKKQVQALRGKIDRVISEVDPEVLVILGAGALGCLVDNAENRKIADIHGKWFDYRGHPAVATFHPQLLLRAEKWKRPAWEDLQEVMRRLSKDPEETRRGENHTGR